MLKIFIYLIINEGPRQKIQVVQRKSKIAEIFMNQKYWNELQIFAKLDLFWMWGELSLQMREFVYM